MALKISIPTSDLGVPFYEAYARITGFSGDKSRLQYQVCVSANAEARQANAGYVATHAFYCPVPPSNIMDGLYADLKTQPGFENAEDC